VAEEDREMFVELLTDEVVGRTYMVPDNIDGPLAEKIFLRYLERAEDPSRYVRVIWAGETAVGVIHDVVSENGTVELGWALISRHHGKGYCTEAVRLAIMELRDLGYKTVTAGAFIETPASLRVMEKNGMKPITFEEIIPYKGKDHLCVCRSLDLEDGANG
jgi:RimJ/RimL family protein N-acetyltransferase